MDETDPAAATAAWLATMSPEEIARAVDYTRGGHWLLLGGFLVSIAVAWLIVRSGLLTGLRARLERSRPRPLLVSFLVGGLYLVLNSALSLPWAIYAGWRRETDFGLSSQPFPAWLSEWLLSAVIGVVIGGVLLIGFFAVIRLARAWWWAWAAGLSACVVLVALIVSPILIEPLFNTYTPAPDGPVRDAVMALAEETGTPSDKIYVFDGSRQSDRYTANVSGLFGSARVAMSDAMFAKGADIAEVRAVVAHEMGHYAHVHVLWQAALLIGLAALSFWLANRLFPLVQRLLGARQVSGVADPAGLPVLAVIVATVGLLATPVLSSWTRFSEADADRFSMVHANEPDGMARALIKTAEYRAPSPTIVEEMLFYSHPSVERRIRAAMEWKAAHPSPDAASTP